MKYLGLFVVSLFVGACATESDLSLKYQYVDTGQACEPDLESLEQGVYTGHMNQGNGNTSPTGIPGDNMDDERSGKIDCYWDGNSGQGDDKNGCEPPEGCDDYGCCGTPDPDDDDGDDDDDDGDGDDDDGDGDDGTDDPTDPGTDDPTDPGTDDPTDPGTDDPTDPGTDDPADPVIVQ